MCYKLEKPYSEKEKIDFIVDYNHNQGLNIEETETALYALQPNEIMVDNEPVADSDFESKQAQAEAERVAHLSLTPADVERGIYKATGKDFEDIVQMVTQLQPQGLDIKALKIELKANHFYRGNPYVSVVGELLGFTPEQLDEFFETNDYTKLISKEAGDDGMVLE